MAGSAIDLQEVPKSLDLVDSTDPLDRNFQLALRDAYTIASTCRAVIAAGTGKFPRPTHIASANQAAYETLVTNAMSAATDAIAALKGIISAT